MIVIVGGGLVGLTTAVALTKTGIDYILLEKRPDVVVKAGASVVLMPVGLRALRQLDLEDVINENSVELGRVKRYDHAGNDLGDIEWYFMMKRRFGSAPRIITRHDLTRVLSSRLDKEKTFCNKNVVDIKSDEVFCADGTSYKGLIFGADGVHSRVRQSQPFTTTYRSLWLRFPSIKEPGYASETHGPGASTQLFSGTDSTVVALYHRLDCDEAEIIAKLGHLQLTPDLTLREAYSRKTSSGVVNLEEGVLKKWSWDNTILLGDAAHKCTPSAAAGYNNGVLDAIALVNTMDGSYQKERYWGVRMAVFLSGLLTATSTWRTVFHKMMDSMMAVKMVQEMMLLSLELEMWQAPVLKC